MKKRILIFALAIFTLLTLTSCGKKFTVTFNADGGTLAGEATVQVKKGKTISEPTAPTKEGYTFAGWYNGETLFDFNTAITANITLVAKWTEGTEITNPVTITFDSDGGSAVAPLTIQKGTIPTKPADPVKEGFVFDIGLKKENLLSSTLVKNYKETLN